MLNWIVRITTSISKPPRLIFDKVLSVYHCNLFTGYKNHNKLKNNPTSNFQFLILTIL